MDGPSLHATQKIAAGPILEPFDHPLTEQSLCDFYRSNLEFLHRAIAETSPDATAAITACLVHAARDLEASLDAHAATARLTERLFANITTGAPGRRYVAPVAYISARLRMARLQESVIVPETIAQITDLCVIHYRRRTDDLVKALADYHRLRIEHAGEILDGLAVPLTAGHPAHGQRVLAQKRGEVSATILSPQDECHPRKRV